MRISPICVAATFGLLAACGSELPAPAESSRQGGSRSAEIVSASRERIREGSPSGGQAELKPLSTPLPGGVVPDFEYHALVDMSTRAHVTIRQVHLDLPTLSAQEGMDRLVAQFEAAGLASGDQAREKATLVRSVWTPSADGAKGIAVVDAGGTHVVLMATDYEDGHSRRDDGYRAMLRLQINSR